MCIHIQEPATASHEVDGVRKEKERLTAATQTLLIIADSLSISSISNLKEGPEQHQ